MRCTAKVSNSEGRCTRSADYGMLYCKQHSEYRGPRIVEKADEVAEMILKNHPAQKLPMEKITAIYFLLSGNKIVYVGQTTHLLQRIGAHQSSSKQFDGVKFLTCSENLLTPLEDFFTGLLNPQYNNLKQKHEHTNARFANAAKLLFEIYQFDFSEDFL